jgi:hypothetical protein
MNQSRCCDDDIGAYGDGWRRGMSDNEPLARRDMTRTVDVATAEDWILAIVVPDVSWIATAMRSKLQAGNGP